MNLEDVSYSKCSSAVELLTNVLSVHVWVDWGRLVIKQTDSKCIRKISQSLFSTTKIKGWNTQSFLLICSNVKKRSRKLEIFIKPYEKLEICKFASISNCWIHLSGKNQVHQMSEHGAKLLSSPYPPFAFQQWFSKVLGFHAGWGWGVSSEMRTLEETW